MVRERLVELEKGICRLNNSVEPRLRDKDEVRMMAGTAIRFNLFQLIVQ